MEIPVLLERVGQNGYRAKVLQPFALSAKGATRAEALAKLRDKIKRQLKKGTEVVGLEIGKSLDPWMEFAGMFQGDPWIEDWKRSVEEYRRSKDAEES